ncbi:MAG TPA: divalent-cation tolerance protein CutA [Vicinamibacterales bacterium]
MPSPFVLVLTTVADADTAATIARTLVDERVAACVNVFPAMRSYYRWQGRVAEDTEHQLLIKTMRDGLERLQQRLLALHPYDVPELIVLPIEAASEAYGTWLAEAVGEEDAESRN